MFARFRAGLLLLLLLSLPSSSPTLALHAPPGLPGAGGPPALPSQGNLYYVAPSGDDGNPGTIDLPWRTVQHAANTLLAGDTVYIRAGTYPEQVVPQNSGSAGQLITYAAYPGELVTLDGAGVTVPPYEGLFYIGAQSYIRVSGLHIVNSNEAGILADGCSSITIDGNSTYNTSSSGIGVWGSSNVVVAGNRVEEACGGGMQECISVAGTDTFAVYGNEVLNCHKEGIDAKDGAANGQVYRNVVHHTDRVAFYVDAWDKHTYNIALFQNLAHDSLDNNGFALASEAGGLLENVQVYNNIAYHNRYLGLAISNCCPDLSPTHPMQGIVIVNNTLYGNGLDPWGGGITVDNPDIQNVTIRNNIVSQNLSFQIVVSAGVPMATLSIDHNLIDGFRGYEGEVRGTPYVEGDPRFVDAAGGNFHLLGDSPAIDQGSSLDAPAVDYDGVHRPYGPGFDIGAYEVVAYAYRVYLPLLQRNH